MFQPQTHFYPRSRGEHEPNNKKYNIEEKIGKIHFQEANIK